MSSVEVDAHDVIKVLLQYFKENNLYRALQALEDETAISLKESLEDESNHDEKSKDKKDIQTSNSGINQSAPPERLLNLIGDAIRWQKQEGLLPASSRINIFSGKAQINDDEEESPPDYLHKHCVKPILADEKEDGDVDIIVSCAEFSPDGQYLLIGYSSGIIEVRSATTGRIAKNLKYQAGQNFMVTPSKESPLCLCFSDQDRMAVGDLGGNISIWRYETGQLLQEFKSAHTMGVTCLVFHRKGRDILSGSHDNTIRLHGMRSNRTILEFQGHKSFVQALAYSRDDNYIVSGSSDKTVRIWNSKTAKEVALYKSSARVHYIHLMPQFKSQDIFLVGSATDKLHLIDLTGKLRAKLKSQDQSDDVTNSNNDEDGGDKREQNLNRTIIFNSTCVSPKGNWIYAVNSDSIYCFNYARKRVEKRLRVHEESTNDLIGVKHHLTLNLLATYDTRGNLKLWRPA